jgi:hypothetical protein
MTQEAKVSPLLVGVQAYRWISQANPVGYSTLKCDGDGSLRMNKLIDARLPRKVSKLQLIKPVPESDTGR